MTKEDTNNLIKAAWVRNLQKRTSIPEDICETFKAWVQGLTNRASAQLTQVQGQPEQGGQQEEAPDGATAPEEGGQEEAEA